jgi:hypothetical protein
MRLRGQRWSNEDGREASSRNWGRLALGLIPLALGAAASVWLGMYIQAHRFGRVLSQEDRAAVAVGAEVRPKGKIAIDTATAQKYCAPITRADLDGDTLRLYATNDCKVALTGMDWHYEQLSPNGTVLHDGYMNQRGNDHCPTPRMVGDKSECVFAGTYGGYMTVDDRVATLRVWTVPYSK